MVQKGFPALNMKKAITLARRLNEMELRSAKIYNKPSYEHLIIGTGKYKGINIAGDRVYTFQIKRMKV